MQFPKFPILGAAANSSLANRWLRLSGVASVAGGLGSINGLAERIGQIFPSEFVIQQFIYMAFAISFICAMFLVLIRNIFTLGLAQIGTVTGFVYLGYSLSEVFLPDYRIVIVIVQCVISTVLAGIFSGSIHYCLSMNSKTDAIASALLFIAFVLLWILPIFITLRI